MRRSVLPVLITGALVCTSIVAGPAAEASSATPKVTGLSSVSGPLAGGAHVVIKGSGLSSVHTVLVGKATARVLADTASRITIVIPGHKSGRVDVRVITSLGESAAVKGDRFTYVAPPTVSSVKPASGPAAGGTRVTVKGKNFLHIKAVLFGKAKGSKVHVVSPTSLTVIEPDHTPGVVDVHVTSAYGSSKTVTADRFTFVTTSVSAVPITSTTPTAAPTTPPSRLTGPTNLPPAPLVITTSSLPDYSAGSTYVGATMTATGGRVPYTWSATGQPVGLTMSAVGVLSGISRSVAGVWSVQITVTDSVGTKTSLALPLSVAEPAGVLYAWGSNVYGQVGNGKTSSGLTGSCTPAYGGVGAVVALGGNARDTYVVKSDGTVWGVGDDTFAQIALPATSTPITTPVAISGLSDVTSIAAGSLDAFALTSTGKVFAWGNGTLGDGQITEQGGPIQVAGGNVVVGIAASLYDTFAVRADGSVVAWGENTFGELGDSGAENYAFVPQVIPGLTGVVSIVANQYSVFALHRDGTVSAWGANSGGDLGVGESATIVNHPEAVVALAGAVQLAEGSSTTYALLGNGTVQAWGYGGTGELGDGTKTTRVTPGPVNGITNAQAIGATADTGYAVLANNSDVAWGANSSCSAGDGTMTEHDTPAPMSKLPTPTLINPTKVLALGSNSLGSTAFGIISAKPLIKLEGK